MKKLFILFLICFAVLAELPTVYAAENVVESPGIKVVVNQQATVYADVPITVGGRVLLPLRAVLTNLGVEDDDRHILWNDAERSVTVLKDSNTVYLKIGSKTAYVNGKSVLLDAAPMVHKNSKTYIPVRFISQALGMKVAWDDAARTVFIKDEEAYNETKDILDKANAALGQVKKARIGTLVKMDLDAQGAGSIFDIDIQAEVDKTAKVLRMHMEMPLFEKYLRFETYYEDNTRYDKDAFSGKWVKSAMTAEEYGKALESNANVLSLNMEEVLCAGLNVSEDSGPGEAILEGEVYPRDLALLVKQNMSAARCVFDHYYIRIFIDRETFLVKKLDLELAGTFSTGDKSSKMRAKADCTYTRLDDGYQIAVPEGLSLK